jgi:hypothetical protein
VVGVGILASTALTAGPSWAAKKSRLCAPGAYPGVLFAQDGSAFTSPRACKRYVAKGGQLVGVNAVAEPTVGGRFKEVCSGFGLKPGSLANCGARWEGGCCTFASGGGPVEPNGTWSGNLSSTCTVESSKMILLFVDGSTAEGIGFERDFPPPSGC